MPHLTRYNPNNSALVSTNSFFSNQTVHVFHGLRENKQTELLPLPPLTQPSASSEVVEWIFSGYIGDFLGWTGEKLANIGAEIIPTPSFSERRAAMRANEQGLRQLFAEALVGENIIEAEAYEILGIYLRHGLVLIKSGELPPEKWKKELHSLQIQAEWAKEEKFASILDEWEKQLGILAEKQINESSKKATWFSFPMAEAAWSPFKGAGLLGNTLKAIFSPADYFMPNDSIKELMEKAGQESKQVVWEVGKEVRLTVREAGIEARATIETAGNEGNKLIANFGKEGKLLIEKAGEEFRVTADDVLKKTIAGTELILHIAGQEARMTTEVVGKEARLVIRETGLEARLTVQETGKVLEGVIEKAGKSSNELVINMGKEGRLFITKVSEEFRFSADHVLKGMMENSQITLETAGMEARLTIQGAGKVANHVANTVGLELRSIITHAGNEYRAISYEMPRLFRLGAESIAAGFIEEAKSQLWGQTELGAIRYKISTHVRDNPEISLEHLLAYVEEQNHLEPQDKAQLYTDLMRYVNNLTQLKNSRNQLELIIGMVALNDPKLFKQVNGWFNSYVQDYTQPILDVIPNLLVRQALIERDENKILDYFGLLPLSKIESDGSVPIGTVIAFPSHVAPEDFTECDGREYSVADFQDLYAVIGKRYGYRIDDKGNEFFKVPDYRGHFLRGWEQAVDENEQMPLLGSIQEDSTRMPHSPFQVEFAGKHTHSAKSSGEHTHAIDASGAHEHITTSAGDHRHKIDGVDGHTHTMYSKGRHSHTIYNSGQHSHAMDESGEHTHKYKYTLGFQVKGGDPNRAEYNDRETDTSKAGLHRHGIHDSGEHAHTMSNEGSHTHPINSGGSHEHTMQITGKHEHKINSSGAHTHTTQQAQSHTHELESAGEHNHILTGGDKETRPRNVQVKFMIKYKSSARNLHQEIKELKEELESTRAQMTENYQSGFFYSTVATSLSVVALVSNTCLSYFKRQP